ncbi:MAG: colanic acid biosynthesis glycosyltransferase WcaL [Rhodospirillaceae bacterium]|nr:colanic acid biosynthesis glycosyltransferase WcaL [Rhodospirillaceae bacterium]
MAQPQAAGGGHGVPDDATIAIVLKGYPRLSETFIAQELSGLERRGLRLRLVSLRHPTDKQVHPIHGSIAAPIDYLPEYLYREPLRVLAGWRAARRLPGYKTARAAWLADLHRDPTPNRIRRFGQALVLAAELPPAIGHLHAHFLHTPASVARYAALLRGLGFSVSAHAKDIWTTPEWEKREKLNAAAWAVVCTRAGRDHLAVLAATPGKIELIYHGLDPARFPPPPPRAARDGGNDDDPVTILSVGRAVAKKGYGDLLDALALLPPALSWRFVHIGGGALIGRLRRRAKRLGLSDRIQWRGALAHDAVLAAYRSADLFVLASRVAKDGDRDGLPNVLLEAASQGLGCVATEISGIPEFVSDGQTGVLVKPGDPGMLAAALAALIGDPARRETLGKAAAQRVRADFALDRGIDRIAARMAESAGPPRATLAGAGRAAA